MTWAELQSHCFKCIPPFFSDQCASPIDVVGTCSVISEATVFAQKIKMLIRHLEGISLDKKVFKPKKSRLLWPLSDLVAVKNTPASPFCVDIKDLWPQKGLSTLILGHVCRKSFWSELPTWRKRCTACRETRTSCRYRLLAPRPWTTRRASTRTPGSWPSACRTPPTGSGRKVGPIAIPPSPSDLLGAWLFAFTRRKIVLAFHVDINLW